MVFNFLHVQSCIFYVVLILALAGCSSAAGPDNKTAPQSSFYSRPDLNPPALTCEINKDGLSPGTGSIHHLSRGRGTDRLAGYIFISPYGSPQSGPYIYDKKCNLVWSGYAVAGPEKTFNFKPCKYQGQDHLCFFQGMTVQGYARGNDLILDNSYTVVKSVQLSGSGVTAADMHEFNLIEDGKSALITSYKPTKADLSAFGIRQGVGYVMDGIFQDIDVQSGKKNFEWHSLDHVRLRATYVFPNSTDTSGTGLAPGDAWDYFHINSIDKSPSSGDYLISARSVSSIYLISAKDGGIIWTLSAGGDYTDYACTNFNFSSQHDARFVKENDTNTIISLLDNASNGFNTTSSNSAGLIINLDHVAKRASLVQRIPPPDPKLIATSQGNTQVLPNGNVFQGWGNTNTLSEHAPDGTPLLSVSWGDYPVLNYRAYSANWTAKPKTQPALYAFAKNRDAGPTSFYVSWNGATDVAEWRFYGLTSSRGDGSGGGGGGVELGTARKGGFETPFQARNYAAFAYAEAIDAHGKVLGRSEAVKTVSPAPGYAARCDDWACPAATVVERVPEIRGGSRAPGQSKDLGGVRADGGSGAGDGGQQKKPKSDAMSGPGGMVKRQSGGVAVPSLLGNFVLWMPSFGGASESEVRLTTTAEAQGSLTPSMTPTRLQIWDTSFPSVVTFSRDDQEPSR
ncbi:ASST-domain-containing protein [Phyllosticta citriasiana]|uniref:ASST-domain-containing protein n=1 Tax=Phyllosticta citriasiana TaxID=595635 RepID=UPI0030FDB6E6